jgi:glycosyltransferase involved in cell wall biosynthesis
MKKIIYFTNTAESLVTLRMSLMKSMKSEGYDVYAGAPRDQNFNIIMNQKISFHNVTMSQMGMNIFEEVRTVINFIKVLRKVKPDIIHFFSVKPIVLGGLASIFFPNSKVISTFTGMGILKNSGFWLRKILFKIIKLSHNSKKIYAFQNQSDLDFFQKHTKIRKRTYMISGSGVDIDRFKQTHDKKSDKITFLMVSRMLYRKGVFEYLQAVKSLNKNLFKKANFLLLGGAYPLNPNHIQEEWLIGSDAIDSRLLLSKSLEAKVEWIEHSNDVLKYLNKSDVVVLPSYYPEGLPRCLLEAMSCDNAIITTKMPGCEDAVDGSNGFLVDPKNVEQLTKCIEKFILMSNSDLQYMQQRSRELVIEKFSDDIVINKYKKLYCELVKKTENKIAVNT